MFFRVCFCVVGDAIGHLALLSHVSVHFLKTIELKVRSVSWFRFTFVRALFLCS